MKSRRALLLLDGLDEAHGTLRERIEKHVAEVLAPQGHVMLCTLRTKGLVEGHYARFHKLSLSPLSNAQQQATLVQRLEAKHAVALCSYHVCKKLPLDGDTWLPITSNPLMLVMLALSTTFHQDVVVPFSIAELYQVVMGVLIERCGMSEASEELLVATFLDAHMEGSRVITEVHIVAAAAATREFWAVADLRALVAGGQLPFIRVLSIEPLQFEAVHFSFQEFFAARALRLGARLDAFGWTAWWKNVVRIGVQMGSSFGSQFVEAADLEETDLDGDVGEASSWRLRVAAAIVREGLPAVWVPMMVDVARADVEPEIAQLVEPLAVDDELTMGRRVLTFDRGRWQKGVVVRVGKSSVDVQVAAESVLTDLPLTKALAVATKGAGALLRAAAAVGHLTLVDALLREGVSALVSDRLANTPLHVAAAAGHARVCRALLAHGAGMPIMDNANGLDPEGMARKNKHNAVVRIFSALPPHPSPVFKPDSYTSTEPVACGDRSLH